MRPPIFAWEPNDLSAFGSIAEAESHTEPYDVDEGVVYDADGRLLAFELAGPGKLWEKRVVLRERETEPTHQDDLRTAIVQASRATGATLDESAPLEQLVQEAFERHRAYKPRRRWSFASRFAKPS